MSVAFAVDTSAVVDLMRDDRPTPPLLLSASSVFLPATVLAELYVGALSSRRVDHHPAALETVASRWSMLAPNTNTAKFYARIRVAAGLASPPSASKSNDLWIAALCLEHNLPLLTNDRGFDGIVGLQVLHW
jgi:tRNA(fMet)-specific endonuclease VapC